MADILSNIVLQFKADTTQAKRAIKELTGEQKKAAKETLDASEKHNASLDLQIAKWGKIAAGVGTAVAAYYVLRDATKKYAELNRLEMASSAAAIDDVIAAANGLITRHEAMKLAAAAMNSTYRATQDELEAAAGMAVILQRRGYDLQKSMEAVQKALVESNAGGLLPFGIEIKAQTGTLDAHNKIVAEFNRQLAQTGELADVGGDSAQRAGARWSDTLDKLTENLGQIGEALSPILEVMAGIAAEILNVGEGLAELMGEGVSFAEAQQGARDRKRVQAFFTERARKSQESSLAAATALKQIVDTVPTAVWKEAGDKLGLGFLDWFDSEPAKKAARGVGKQIAESAIDKMGEKYRQQYFAGQAGPARGSLGRGASFEDLIALQQGAGQQYGAGSLLDAPRSTETPGGMSQESLSNLQDATVAFTDAFLASVEAVVAGSSSISEAFRNMAASTLRAISGMARSKALFHVAEGIAALAGGVTAAAAAPHFKAAAAYGVASVVAGGLAARIGSSGGGSGGGGGMPAAAAGAVGGDRGLPTGGSNMTVYVGSDFEDNPRANAARLRRAMERAGKTSGSDSVVFDA